MENIRSEILEPGVHVLTFDRAESAANIFDRATLDELNEKLAVIEQAGTAVKGVVFISAKPAIFIAGADLNALETLTGDGLREFIELGQTTFSRIAALRAPTVAAIHGACVGGGYELALACNRRIATPDRVTKIGLPETGLGILPAWGGSTRLPRLIGVPGALDVILGAKQLPAKAALKRGMIDDIAHREQLLDAALEWLRKPTRASVRWHLPVIDRAAAAVAERVASRQVFQKSRGHYPAPVAALDVITHGITEDIESSLRRERVAVLSLAMTPECRNLIRLYHLTERAKKLRVPGVEKPAQISRVAVIGAGVMGSAIAQWLSSRGMRVLMREIDPKYVAAGMARIAGLYAAAVKRRILDKTEARDAMDRIAPVAGEAPLNGIDLVIEAAVEKMELKKKIFARLDETAPAQTILATNTSALSITELAASVKRQGQVVGIHFFNPVHQMQLVEVVSGEQTGAETTAAALRFVQKIGKMPVLVRDSPGFLVNRILLPYLVEAATLFERGAATAEIDSCMLDFGMPMGPLRLIDEVGLDVADDVAATLAAAFPAHMHVPGAVQRMLAAKMLGKKSGSGFYIHAKKKAVPNPAANQYRAGTDAASLSRAEMQTRMVLLIINEAARCLEEKVVAEAADVDFGMIMGTGFAPFRGGPLRYADTLGAKVILGGLNAEAARSGPAFAPCALIQQMAAAHSQFY